MSCVGLGSTWGSQLEVSTGDMSDGLLGPMVTSGHYTPAMFVQKLAPRLRRSTRPEPRLVGVAQMVSGYSASLHSHTTLFRRDYKHQQVIMRRLTHRLRDRQRTHRRGNSSSH